MKAVLAKLGERSLICTCPTALELAWPKGRAPMSNPVYGALREFTLPIFAIT